MDGHLVAVEVGVESRTYEGVHLNGITFDEHWLECLNAEAVQGRSAIQKHVFAADDLFQDLPNFLGAVVYEAVGATDIVG